MTTKETEMTTTTTITAEGVTATTEEWAAAGYPVYSSENGQLYTEIRRHDGLADLMAAKLATGASDWRVLGEVIRAQRAANEERTRSTATARLAEALDAAQLDAAQLVESLNRLSELAAVVNRVARR